MKILKYSTVIALLLMLTQIDSASAAIFPKKGAKRDRERVTKVIYDTIRVIDTVVVPVAPYRPWCDTLNLAQTPRQRDVIIAEWCEQSVTESFEEYFDRYIKSDTVINSSAASLPDSVYARRLRELLSPVQLPYNPIVKGYISRYTDGDNSLISRILSLAQYYFPLFEEELIKQEMPVELRMLPIIESALQINAVSRAGAVGLWQFITSTGKSYGLEINSLVDERRDPIASTRAACRFLSELYDMFGDWTLALAAYNCGPGNVNKAIARAGNDCKTFWDIYDFLPRETRGYVPAFIGATYAFNYHRQHDIEIKPSPLPLATDTLCINKVMHFEQIASTIDCPIETLRALNPQYRLDIIPANNRTYTLILPQRCIADYIAHEEEIMAKDSTYLKEYMKPDNLEKKRRQSGATVYRVKRGDTLGAIARKYGVSVSSLMRWNNIKSANRIREGQVLKIEGR